MVISVEICGVTYRATDQYGISQSAGAVSSSNIDILVGSEQAVPRALSCCKILKDGEVFFSGLIMSVESPEFNGGKEAKRYRLTLQSKEVILNNRLVSEAFAGKYTHEIVQTLFENYIADEGITLGAISTTTKQYSNYNFSFTKLYDILFELAEAVNASFYISSDDKFYFLTRDAFTQIDAPEHITNLKLEEEIGDLRTVQIITGATEETGTQTQSTVWIADQTVINLGYSIATMNGITINGAIVGVGILGVDDEDTAKTFLYNTGQNTVTLNTNATVKPSAGDIVVVVYKGLYDIVVYNTNESLQSSIASLSGTSGKIETILTDETIKTYSDAEAKAADLLAQYGDYEQTVSCSLHDLASSELYTMWLINRPDLNIAGQFVITEREVSAFGVGEMWVRIKLKNKNYFARYGSMLVDTSKTSGGDTKVYQNSNIADSISMSDALDVQDGGIPFWPSSSGIMYPDMGGNFYVGS